MKENHQDGCEPKSRQHSGQQEPHAGEHESAYSSSLQPLVACIDVTTLIPQSS